MNNWQPIETAPKDGYPIFVRGNNYNDPAKGQHHDWAFWDGENWIAVGNDASKLLYLTHWMPKP